MKKRIPLILAVFLVLFMAGCSGTPVESTPDETPTLGAAPEADTDNSTAATATEKAGAVYYSEPNRIVLFYEDAEVSGEYTPVGYIDDSEA